MISLCRYLFSIKVTLIFHAESKQIRMSTFKINHERSAIIRLDWWPQITKSPCLCTFLDDEVHKRGLRRRWQREQRPANRGDQLECHTHQIPHGHHNMEASYRPGKSTLFITMYFVVYCCGTGCGFTYRRAPATWFNGKQHDFIAEKTNRKVICLTACVRGRGEAVPEQVLHPHRQQHSRIDGPRRGALRRLLHVRVRRLGGRQSHPGRQEFLGHFHETGTAESISDQARLR